jgi:hypothetical protein
MNEPSASSRLACSLAEQNVKLRIRKDVGPRKQLISAAEGTLAGRLTDPADIDVHGGGTGRVSPLPSGPSTKRARSGDAPVPVAPTAHGAPLPPLSSLGILGHAPPPPPNASFAAPPAPPHAHGAVPPPQGYGYSYPYSYPPPPLPPPTGFSYLVQYPPYGLFWPPPPMGYLYPPLPYPPHHVYGHPPPVFDYCLPPTGQGGAQALPRRTDGQGDNQWHGQNYEQR